MEHLVATSDDGACTLHFLKKFHWRVSGPMDGFQIFDPTTESWEGNIPEQVQGHWDRYLFDVSRMDELTKFTCPVCGFSYTIFPDAEVQYCPIENDIEAWESRDGNRHHVPCSGVMVREE